MEIRFWYWLIFGMLLVTLEVFAPGVAFLWLGIAALVLGVVVWLMPELAWEYQVLLFSALSIASLVLAWRFFRRRPIESTNPNLNVKGSEYLGKVYPLAAPVESGIGRVRIGDGLWRVSCEEDLPAGTRVRVTGLDGATLKVEPADRAKDDPASSPG